MSARMRMANWIAFTFESQWEYFVKNFNYLIAKTKNSHFFNFDQ
jgi:hypothetical protein